MSKTHKESFNILNRWTGKVQATVKITCRPDDLPSVKLGLAVQVAHDTGARLDGARLDGARLDGARLVGARLVGARLDGAQLDGASLVRASLVRASLDGASLDGASLDGANLVRASLDGALIRDDKITRFFASVNRSDGYTFHAFELSSGGYKLLAGCRWQTDDAFRDRIASEYPTTKRNSSAFLAETHAILDFIRLRAEQCGVSVTQGDD